MQKNLLIGISVVAACVIVLASYTNVVGVQIVKSSNQKAINNEVDQKELLFQTILDIANNKEIQKVILGSEITEKRFFGPDIKFSTFTPPVLTEKFLKRMYTMGVILSKTISKSKIHSMLGQYRVSNQGVQKEINAVIEKDAALQGEMTQLSSLSCDCENENTTVWHFPVICTLLYPLAIIIDNINGNTGYFELLDLILWTMGQQLHCFWAY